MAIHQAKSHLYFVLSDFECSRAEGERLLALARQMGDRVREGAALAAMGHASFWAHDFDRALVYTHQAIAIVEEADAKPVLAAGHFTICFILSATGQLAPAKKEIEHALAISRSVGDVHHQSLSLGRAGQLKNWEGEYGEATRLQSEGLRIAREHNLLVPRLQPLLVRPHPDREGRLRRSSCHV
jgi:tetratricopeptide (TPR) repeat protein